MSKFDMTLEHGSLVIRVPVRVETAQESSEAREKEAKQRLTRRELEVFERIRRRLTNKEIAAEINISTRTVTFHVSSLLQKFGCTSRWELVQKFGFKD